MNLEEERDALKRELIGVQEMLAFVLATVGEPVAVSKQTLTAGLPAGTQIVIDEDMQTESFVFRLDGVEA